MEFSFQTRVNAPRETIWSYYADVRKWGIWEDDLEDISLDGAFETGATGTMKLAGMPPLDVTLTEVEPNRRFCDKTPTPMGDVYFHHELLEDGEGVSIRHSVRLDTPECGAEALGFLRQIFADVPDSILALKRAVER